MADRIHLSIVTPDGKALDETAQYVNIPTERGSLGILANHAPMLCAVSEGVLRWRRESGDSFEAHIGSGVASVNSNNVSLLVTMAKLNTDEEKADT